VSNLFICYSRVDKTLAEQLAGLLLKAYNHVWFDDNLHGGEEWWAEIVKEIAGCHHFIFLISDDALESHWCSKELSEAQRLNKHIVPVLVRARTAVPEWLQKIQQISMTNGITVDGLNQLYATLIRYGSGSVTPRQIEADSRLLERLWLFMNGSYIEELCDQIQRAKIDWEKYTSHVTKYLDLRAKARDHFANIALEEVFEAFDDALIRLDGQIGWTYELYEESGHSFMREPRSAHDDTYWFEKYNRLVRRATDVWIRHAELVTTSRTVLPSFDVMKEY
jgi:hypothetical protein